MDGRALERDHRCRIARVTRSGRALPTRAAGAHVDRLIPAASLILTTRSTQFVTAEELDRRSSVFHDLCPPFLHLSPDTPSSGVLMARNTRSSDAFGLVIPADKHSRSAHGAH